MSPSFAFMIGFGFVAIAFVLAFVTTPLSIFISRRANALDVPKDDRRMHDAPIPRLGGIAIFLSFLISAFILSALIREGYIADLDAVELIQKLHAILIAGSFVFLLGVVDDMKGMRARYKLLGQIGCSALAFALGVRIPAVTLFGWQFASETGPGLFVSFLVTVIWLVAITNMINLIDGLDGLAAGVVGIAALAIAYSAFINGYPSAAFTMAIIAGAALGFLPFNFYPAKVFMGDSGAMFLGFALAAVSIISPAKGATVVAIIAPVIVLGVPLFDIIFAMFRRVKRHESIFKPDKGHLHHQLSKIGIGQRRSVLMLYGISGIMGIAAIVFSRELYLEAVGLFFIAVVFIIVLIWGWDKNKD